MNNGLAAYTLRRGGSTRVVAKGNEGPMARQAQKHLKAIGHPVKVNGKFDDMTEAAVREFQAKHGLPETGVVDAMTMGALLAAPKTAPAPVGLKRGGLAPGMPHPHMPKPHIPVPGGLIQSNVAGRTDRLPIAVPRNAYVIPADVVSGLGQGNSSAGGILINKILHPHSMRMKQHKPPNIFRRASGGDVSHETNEPVPIVAAGGEYIVDPDTVHSIGEGDFDKGHKILDGFVLNSRKQIVDRMKTLPGPKR